MGWDDFGSIPDVRRIHVSAVEHRRTMKKKTEKVIIAEASSLSHPTGLNDLHHNVQHYFFKIAILFHPDTRNYHLTTHTRPI
jgi:hypothetical protein